MNSPEKKVCATMVLETIGRPAEYLTQTLNEIVEKISKEQGTKVKNSKINPPVILKEHNNFYSSFAEIDVETENILYLVILVFKYMPAHVEIISPQIINLTNFEWGDILSEIARKLQGYDEIVRITQNEKVILENKLREIMSIKPKVVINDKKEENIEKEPKKKSDKKD